LVVQGTGFNWPAPDHLRVVTLPWARDLGNAIQRLGNFLRLVFPVDLGCDSLRTSEGSEGVGMRGSHALVRSLVDAGVDVCFMNPGTSEMHFVDALDAVPRMRGVLALFEGVATGAADGYARITGRPAAVLLHLGPGLGNGLANLHNARRAHTPVVCIVGAHATYHEHFDAPLQSDITTVARNVSAWVQTSGHPRDVAAAAMDAVASARRAPGSVSILVLPADVSWSEGAGVAAPREVAAQDVVGTEVIDSVAALLRGEEPSMLMLGGEALHEGGLRAASRIAVATGATLLAETFPARLERGAGLPAIDRLGYLAEQAESQLSGIQNLVLVGARWPVSFFAYPEKKSDLVPEGCHVETLADGHHDVTRALEDLAEAVAAGVGPVLQAPAIPADPTGELTVQTLAEALAVTIPEHAIIVDEANTSGFLLPSATAGSPRHDLLTLTGGAIGQGMPVATGAAVAAPGRSVLNVQADGSALYTIQSLWTQAREQLDVTTVLINNSAYAILRMELQRVGAQEPGPRALEMLDLSRPDLNFTDIARGLGVPAVRVSTAEALVTELRRGLAEPGPHLIEAMVPAL